MSIKQYKSVKTTQPLDRAIPNYDHCEYISPVAMINEYSFCYGEEMWNTMSPGNSQFILRDEVGPDADFPKTVVIIYDAPW